MSLPDADTLWVLVPCSLLLVAQVLDWFGVELGEQPEPRGFEVKVKGARDDAYDG